MKSLDIRTSQTGAVVHERAISHLQTQFCHCCRSSLLMLERWASMLVSIAKATMISERITSTRPRKDVTYLALPTLDISPASAMFYRTKGCTTGHSILR